MFTEVTNIRASRINMSPKVPKAGNVVIRNRREVVQHAAAFQHIINEFVKREQPMTEELIKSTHRILTTGLDPADSGFFGYTSFGGKYRTGDQHVLASGIFKYTSPAKVQDSMKSLVASLQKDIAEIEKTGSLDPFMLAAKYCDRFVNIHPFRDGNGRMCRLILNAILLKFAGVIIVLGEGEKDRVEDIDIAKESTRVGGHAGQLGKKVLEMAEGTLRRIKGTSGRHLKFGQPTT
jgi:prophage maintenance system killer protein